MRDLDRKKRPLQRSLPERQELEQFREFRTQIVILPDVGLQQRWMVRHAIQNLRRRQPVTQHLFPEVLGNPNPRDDANLHCWSASATVARPRATRWKMRSHKENVTHTTNASQA